MSIIRNFDEPIRDISGEVIIDERTNKSIPLKRALAEAVAGNYDRDSNLSFEEKDRRYRLARRIAQGGDIRLTPQDISTVTELATKGLTTAVFGQVMDVLNADSEEEKTEKS